MDHRLQQVKGRGYTFWDRVDITGDCWEWLSNKNEKGYGRLWFNGRSQKAYRVAYEMLLGEIPKYMELDHLCHNRGCVNVSHLEPVTHIENTRRMSRKIHCGYGHEFIPENTYTRPDTGARSCKECQRRIGNDWRRKNDIES